MKSIAYRGGLVTFRIPAHWREEYSDLEGGTFYGNDSDSGTLRLTIITVSQHKQVQPPSPLAVLESLVNGLRNEGVVGTTNERKDGTVIFKYQQATSERGVRLTIFYWITVNAVPPHHARIATFSYTIPHRKRHRSQVQHDVEMLESEIEAASFSAELGVVAE